MNLRPASWSDRTLGVVLFALLWATYFYVHPVGGWNDASRMDVLHAIFRERTLSIDSYHENTGDKALYDGRYYSDKAPGGVFLAIPAYGAAHTLAQAMSWSGAGADRMISWVTAAGSAGLLAAAGMAAMFFLLLPAVGRRTAFLVMLFTGLGTGMLPYATMLFSHSMTAGLLALALYLLYLPLHQPQRGKGTMYHAHLRAALAGFLCSFAFITEYPAAIPGACIFVLVFLRSPRHALWFLAGAVPPVLMLLFYNQLAFGSALTVSYFHTTYPSPDVPHVAGITSPKFSNLLFLLLSPARGLFVWSPFLVLAFCGIPGAWRFSRGLTIAACIACFLILLLIASHAMPGGGSALGPRHLTLILPFMAFLTAFGFRRFPFIGMVLGIASALCYLAGTLISPLVPQVIVFPFTAYLLPLFSKGALQPTLPGLTGAHVYVVCAVPVLLLIAGCFIGNDAGDQYGANRRRKGYD